MTNLKKKIAVGVASLALVAGMGVAPALAADEATKTLPGAKITEIKRLSGVDRIDTSLAVARHEFRSATKHTAKVAYLVNYTAFIDGVTAGVLTDGPIVLVDNNRRTAGIIGGILKEANDDKGAAGFAGIKEIIAVGGTGVVTDDTLKAVADAAKVKRTSRIGGADRYETSALIADRVLSQVKSRDYKGRVDFSGGRLTMAYIANGEDSHVVDSMVAGVLDDGPILLVPSNGQIPEKVANFIKSSLPHTFGVLGGKAAVAPETVNAARVLSVYDNNWKDAPNVPALRKKVNELRTAIDGSGARIDRYTKSTDFMGYKLAARDASVLSSAWSAKFGSLRSDLNGLLAQVAKDKKTEAELWEATGNFGSTANTKVGDAFQMVYGNAASEFSKVKVALSFNDQKVLSNWSLGDFEDTSTELKKSVEDAQKVLQDAWNGDQPIPADNTVAGLSQRDPNTAGILGNTSQTTKNDPSVYAVTKVANWVSEVLAKELESNQSSLNEANQKLAAILNQIDATSEVRLGGKDRYATAAAVAQYWARHSYFNHAASQLEWPDVYVATGNRLADAVVAGQLTGGPILLAHPGKELDAQLAFVADTLPFWQNKPGNKTLYGVGGTAVLDDAVLKALATRINDAVKEANKDEAKAKKAVTIDKTSVEVKADASDSAEVTVMYDGKAAEGVTATSSDTSKFTVSVANNKVTIKAVNGTTAADTAEVTIKVANAESGSPQTVKVKALA